MAKDAQIPWELERKCFNYAIGLVRRVSKNIRFASVQQVDEQQKCLVCYDRATNTMIFVIVMIKEQAMPRCHYAGNGPISFESVEKFYDSFIADYPAWQGTLIRLDTIYVLIEDKTTRIRHGIGSATPREQLSANNISLEKDIKYWEVVSQSKSKVR